MNMDQVASAIDLTRQGLQKSIELNTLRIDKAVLLAKVLKLKPEDFLLSFLDSHTEMKPDVMNEKLDTLLKQQEEIIKILQKKNEYKIERV